MSSLVSTILNKNWTPAIAPGRVIRFGEDGDPALRTGSIRKRVLYCLRTNALPLDVERIADAVEDRTFRVAEILRRLIAEGLVEEIGSSFHTRYRLA